MKRSLKITLWLVILLAGALFAQQATNIFRLLPATNSTGVPTATGELRFLDLTNPGSGTPHYWGLKAPTSLPGNYVFTGPSMAAGHTTGCWTSDGSLVITLDPTCGGAVPPFSDATVHIFNSSDPTKRIQFNAGSVPTGTVITLSTQGSVSYTLAGKGIDNQFTIGQTIFSSGSQSGLTIQHTGSTTPAAWFLNTSASSQPPLLLQGNQNCSQCPAEHIQQNGSTGSGIQIDMSSSATQAAIYTNGSILPQFTNTSGQSVGTSSLRWNAGYFNTIDVASCTGCGGVPPFSDATVHIFNSSDPTKRIQFNAGSVPTGTVITLSTQGSVSYTLAGKGIDNQFTIGQTIFSSGSQSGLTIQHTGSTTPAAWFLNTSASSQPPLLLQGNQNCSQCPAEHIQQLGSSGSGIQIDMSFSPTQAAIYTNGSILPQFTNTSGQSVGSSSLSWNDGYFNNLHVTSCTGCGSGVTSVSGTSPIASSGGSTPAISCSTCLTAGTGKKLATGVGTFSSGIATFSTGLSSVDSIQAMILFGSLTPSEYPGFDTSSGGSVTLKSSNTSSGFSFYWMAVGNP